MNYPGTTQYQRLAEPVVAPPLDTGETVLLDKWFHQTSLPTRRRKSVAVIAPFIAFVNFAATEPIDALTIDKWFVRQPDPTRRKPRAAEFQPFTVDPSHLGDVESVNLDKWFVRGPDPTRRLKRTAEFYSFSIDASHLGDAETITIDKWLGFGDVPNRRLRPIIPDQARDPLQEISAAEVVTLDKWLNQRPEPTRRIPRVAWLQPFTVDPFRLLDAETITLDKWIGSNELLRRKLLPRLSDQLRDPLQDLGGAEELTIDKWLARYPDVVRRKPSTIIESESFVYPEQATLDKWLARFPDSFRRKLAPSLGWESIVHPEEKTIDKWAPQLPELFRLRRGLVAAQFFAYTELDIIPPEVITLDKWWRPASEPQRIPKRLSARHIPSYERTELEIVPITWTTYGGPFLYTSANWSASTLFYFEAYFRSASGTCRARLVNQAGTPVSGSEVTTTSATHVRLRSGAITLTDGNEYFAQFGEDSGATGFFLLARVIGI